MKSGSVTKVRASLNGEGKTHADLKTANPDLTDGQISMALGYLKRKGLIEAEMVPRVRRFGRQNISSYRLKHD